MRPSSLLTISFAQTITTTQCTLDSLAPKTKTFAGMQTSPYLQKTQNKLLKPNKLIFKTPSIRLAFTISQLSAEYLRWPLKNSRAKKYWGNPYLTGMMLFRGSDSMLIFFMSITLNLLMSRFRWGRRGVSPVSEERPWPACPWGLNLFFMAGIHRYCYLRISRCIKVESIWNRTRRSIGALWNRVSRNNSSGRSQQLWRRGKSWNKFKSLTTRLSVRWGTLSWLFPQPRKRSIIWR